MRVRSFALMVLVLVMLIAGCSQQSLMKLFVSPEEEQVAKNYIGLLRAQKFDQIENDIDPAIKAKSPNIHQMLLKMAALMPAEDPLSVKLVGANSFTGNTVHKSNITYEYQYPDRWLMVNVAVQKKDGVSTLIGFNVRKLPDSLENSNKFGLSGKSALQYAVLAAAVIAPLFSLYALVLCIRTKMQSKKWLWIVCILLGIGGLSINWTTGNWNFQPLYVQLFSVSAFAPMYGAWTICVSLPLGAIWFVLRRKALNAPIEEAN